MLKREDLRIVPLSDYTEKIEKGEVFSVVRYGDGEWFSILQCSRRPCNSDHHRYYKALGEELAVLLHGPQKYDFGFGPVTFKSIGGNRVPKYLAEQKIERDWICASIFARAAIQRKVLPFLQALQKKPLVFVGPDRIRPAAKLLKATHFVPVPLVNAYTELHRVAEQTLQALEQTPKPAVCSIAMGIPAALLVEKIHQRFGDEVWGLDIGSIYEPLVGVAVRAYHRELLQKYPGYIRSLKEELAKAP